MNMIGIRTLYGHEMIRFFRTIAQGFISPVVSTSLYFVVFGGAIGSRIEDIDGVTYAAFIVPGLIMLSVMTQSSMNASFGIYFPRFFGSIYEVLAAPLSALEITIGYVGAAATKSLIIASVILLTSSFFIDIAIEHPVAMVLILIMSCVNFSLLGFILGIVGNNFEQIQFAPLLIITPLVYLGGSFYAISMLPPFWEAVTYLNPIMYLISAYRWSFIGVGDVPILLSFGVMITFTLTCFAIIWWMFKTGWRIRT